MARPRPAPGYAGLRDSLGLPDPLLLSGRRIVIDPGHGGWFKGCVGVGGLTEAEVNLGVALELRTLLTERGAVVLLTRDRDRDFLTPADSSLKHDLAERVRMANAFRPDLFLSVHHNADPGGAHDVNETQTYYQLGDDGPSYDAGTDVHRSLVRNLGIEAQRLLPGNFAVVRGVECPALLTEASYLTNPDVEARLRTPEARRLEAEALLLGLERYFARKAPVVDSVWYEEQADETGEAWSLTGREGGRYAIHAHVQGAFDEASVSVDGEAVAFYVVGDELTAPLDQPLRMGAHEAAVSARLAGEGTSRFRRLPFEIKKIENVVLEADIPYSEFAPTPAVIPVRIRAFDVDHVARPDSVAIDLHAVLPRTLVPRDTTVWARDGIAWAYFRTRRSGHNEEPIRLTMQTPGDEDADNPAKVFKTQYRVDLTAKDCRTGFVLAMPAGVPLRNAPGTLGWTPIVTWINRDGLATVRANAAGAFVAPQLPGFRAWGPDTAWPPRFVAIAGGALAGRRIVLDPEGGGDDAAGTGPSGTRAASLNLDVAHALAGMLAASGAEVLITREGDAAVSEVERVQRGEGFRPDRYLRIGHAAATPIAGHYFSSAGGRRWGQRLADACTQLGLEDSLHVGEVAKYALTQTSATALYASLARVDSAASEARLLAPGALRREAYALYLALAADFSPDTHWGIDSLEVRDAAGAPLPAALVTLGGALVLQAGPDGRVRFARTEPGPLEVNVLDPRAMPRVVLLESDRARVPSGAR